MKDPKFYVGIVIGFSMSLVLLSTVLVVAPVDSAPTIGTDNIVDDAIISPKIKDSQVKTQDLANGTVIKDKRSPLALKLVTVSRYANITTDRPHHFIFLHGIVKCDTGETATGGGYFNPDPYFGAVTYWSSPLPDNSGWHVAIFNNATVRQFTAYVVCAHLELAP